jgi:glycosyltransferase involved in cell wall biosynthesis
MSCRWRPKCAAPQNAQEPFLALVVPVYNTPPEYLDALVASVRMQRRGAWELILSDDGCTALPACAWLDSHAADADLRIVRNPRNQGIAGATNAGVAVATAPWIGFLDHDDALAPGALDRIAEALEGAPDCQFLYTTKW